jgi:DNA-directed RNA polymerase subunit L
LEYAPRRVLRVRTTGAVTAREALVAALRTTRERMLVLLATM